jgi:putative glycosyltransferase (TIGR04372 family)
VSTGTGIDAVPVVYGRPVVFVNYIPLAYLVSFGATVTVPKHLVMMGSDRPLTLREYVQHAYLRKDQYDRAGIRAADLSATEILDAVLEMERHVDGTWTDDHGEAARQRRFWEVLRSWKDFDRHHHVIHPGARVGSAWLKSNGDGFLA